MWTKENRHRYDCKGLRYPTDLTDEEWDMVRPELSPARRGGRRRIVDEREIVNGLMFVLGTGCQWRAIPSDLPARSTLHGYLMRWDYDGTLARIHYALYVKCRELAARKASPTAAIHHRQPKRQKRRKRGACIDPKGYDAGKKISGKKRHILVDTEGLMLHAVVHPADIQDRDGGVLVMATLFGRYPFLRKLFAESGYQGPKFAEAIGKRMPELSVEIVKRSDRADGFEILPRRWIVTDCTELPN